MVDEQGQSFLGQRPYQFRSHLFHDTFLRTSLSAHVSEVDDRNLALAEQCLASLGYDRRARATAHLALAAGGSRRNEIYIRLFLSFGSSLSVCLPLSLCSRNFVSCPQSFRSVHSILLFVRQPGEAVAVTTSFVRSSIVWPADITGRKIRGSALRRASTLSTLDHVRIRPLDTGDSEQFH